MASDLAVVLADLDLVEFIMAEESQLLANEVTDQRVVIEINNQHVAIDNVLQESQRAVLDGQANIQKGIDMIHHGKDLLREARDLRDELDVQIDAVLQGRSPFFDFTERGNHVDDHHQDELKHEESQSTSQSSPQHETQNNSSSSSSLSSFDVIHGTHAPRTFGFQNLTIDQATNAYHDGHVSSRSGHTVIEPDRTDHHDVAMTGQHHSLASPDRANVGQVAVTNCHDVMSIASMIDPSLESATSPETISHGQAETVNPANMKRELPDAFNLVPAMNKKAKGDQDPENHEIYRLRNKENRGFDDIAKIMNEHRVAAGKSPNFTSNAIYSRYKRNAAQIAHQLGEMFRPCKMDIDSGTVVNLVSFATQFDKREDDLLVEAYLYVMNDTWRQVSQRLQELGGRYHEPNMCAHRCAQMGMK